MGGTGDGCVSPRAGEAASGSAVPGSGEVAEPTPGTGDCASINGSLVPAADRLRAGGRPLWFSSSEGVPKWKSSPRVPGPSFRGHTQTQLLGGADRREWLFPGHSPGWLVPLVLESEFKAQNLEQKPFFKGRRYLVFP